MRGASFHCDLFASNLLRLLRASNFRVPNGRRYCIVIHAHGAGVTWTSDDRGHRTPGRGTRSLVYTTPSTPFRARHQYTTLDQSSPDDEPIITVNDNCRSVRRGEAQERPQRRCTTCSSHGTITALRSGEQHGRRGRLTRRSRPVSE